jgi:hypothetical protein|tara:strand:+ start:922 stop:1386 length:465 start_codon:yes stop_codon:yes gene_type:complete
MANYCIFGVNGAMIKLSKSEDQKNKFLHKYDPAVAKEISDAQYLAASQDTLTLYLEEDVVKEMSNQTYDSNRPDETDSERDARWKETFEEELNYQKYKVGHYVDFTSDAPAEWVAYKNNLYSVNVDNVTFPIESFQKWFNSQSGFSQLTMWELP